MVPWGCISNISSSLGIVIFKWDHGLVTLINAGEGDRKGCPSHRSSYLMVIWPLRGPNIKVCNWEPTAPLYIMKLLSFHCYTEHVTQCRPLYLPYFFRNDKNQWSVPPLYLLEITALCASETRGGKLGWSRRAWRLIYIIGASLAVTNMDDLEELQDWSSLIEATINGGGQCKPFARWPKFVSCPSKHERTAFFFFHM